MLWFVPLQVNAVAEDGGGIINSASAVLDATMFATDSQRLGANHKKYPSRVGEMAKI